MCKPHIRLHSFKPTPGAARLRGVAGGGTQGLRDQDAHVQQIRLNAEELRCHDRDLGMLIFQMKDLTAEEGVLRQGAKLAEVEVKL